MIFYHFKAYFDEDSIILEMRFMNDQNNPSNSKDISFKTYLKNSFGSKEGLKNSLNMMINGLPNEPVKNEFINIIHLFQ